MHVLPAEDSVTGVTSVAADRDAGSAKTGELRRGAASELMQRHPEMLVPLAGSFMSRRPEIESAIRGSSMWPSIPAGSRLRIRVDGGATCPVGNIVYYQNTDGYVVHRIVHRGRWGAAAGYVLTRGEGCITPDPPVPLSSVVGTVVAMQQEGAWQPLGPRGSGSSIGRLARSINLTALIVLLMVSPRLARPAAALLQRVETAWRIARESLACR